VKTYLLKFLKEVGLLNAVPESPPGKGKVLARGVCPLHEDADNPHGFLLYADGFACTTVGCHKERGLGSNLEGLVRHLAHRLTGDEMTWHDAWAFARKNVSQVRELVATCKARPANTSSDEQEAFWTADEVVACLEVPSRYYLKRGFRPETLEHFGVGDCVRPLPDGRNLLGWPVVPVPYSWDRGLRAGYTARNPRFGDGVQKVKWLHAFPKRRILFNVENACKAYREPFILCEGPGDVFRFYEGGQRGAMATCGGALSESQYFASFVLKLDGRRAVYIAADADEPGEKFAQQTKNLVQGVCPSEPTILRPPAGRRDFGEATPDEIRALELA
jgi:5S rRNA maturation endonuclease (ribonuclease M5)